ncbi:hypothetical protein E4K73_47275 [Streptomyces sp. IB201691-2A2]|nr:hypothetical protein E4K73_47275 [Streptomyces sp. IB201691-2A2]
MTSSALPPPISEPDPSTFTCSSSMVGPCSGCQRSTHRYGSGGLPLCRSGCNCACPLRADPGGALQIVRQCGF